ncbi:hypothetical protein ACOSP7_002126 [Xanthoceras sorbifolium]
MEAKGRNGSNPTRKAGPVTMERVLLASQETREEREQRIQSLFNFFDLKNSGFLDSAQIQAGLSSLNIPSEYKYGKDLLTVFELLPPPALSHPILQSITMSFPVRYSIPTHRISKKFRK